MITSKASKRKSCTPILFKEFQDSVLNRVKEDHCVKGTTAHENKRRRAVCVTRKNGVFGYTIQTYGIKREAPADPSEPLDIPQCQPTVHLITFIDYVALESPAYYAGLKRGWVLASFNLNDLNARDVILAVNGISMESTGHEELVAYIASQQSIRMVVLFEDCSQKIDLNLRYLKLKEILDAKLKELASVQVQEKVILVSVVCMLQIIIWTCSPEIIWAAIFLPLFYLLRPTAVMPHSVHPGTNNGRRNTRRASTHKEAGLTWMLAFSVFVVSLSSFQYGFSLTLNVPVKDMVKWYNHIYNAQHSKTLAEAQAVKWVAMGIGIMYLAAILGSLISVYVSDHYGRLRSLQISDLVAICGAILLGNARQAASIEMIIIGKFLEGLSMGILSVAVPLYLVEVAPLKMRGSLVTIHALGISLGALVSPLLGLFLATYGRWHVLLGIFAIPSSCQLVLSLCIPESPRFLFITKDDEYSTKKVLIQLRGPRRKHSIRDEMEEMGFEIEAQSMIAPSNRPWNLLNVNLRKALFTAIAIHISQSLFRIDAGMLYIIPFISNALPFTTFVFLVCIALLTVLLTMLAIGIIAKTGIRTLFLVTCTCMTACSALLTIFMILYQHSHHIWPAYIGFLLMALYKCFFTMGPSVVPWIISTKLFTQNTRSMALCMCLIANWVGDIGIGIFFALFYQWVKSYIWLIYTMLLVGFLIVAFNIIPETKKKTFLDLARQFSTSYHESLIPL